MHNKLEVVREMAKADFKSAKAEYQEAKAKLAFAKNRFLIVTGFLNLYEEYLDVGWESIPPKKPE